MSSPKAILFVRTNHPGGFKRAWGGAQDKLNKGELPVIMHDGPTDLALLHLDPPRLEYVISPPEVGGEQPVTHIKRQWFRRLFQRKETDEAHQVQIDLMKVQQALMMQSIGFPLPAPRALTSRRAMSLVKPESGTVRIRFP